MQAEGREDRSAHDAAHAYLLAGQLSQARRIATEALKTNGPDARLFLVLGRAHAAEDDDDHDDLAERTYQDGLEAFPDDLELLAAYAELCLRSDYLDHPARYRRGPELAARLRELAPDSEHALRAEQLTAGKVERGPRPPSPVRTQMYDARLVLVAVGDPASAAAQARAHAQERPDDQRLATLAETLTALAGPGRAPLRWMVRFPERTLLIRAALCVAVLLAVPAFRWDGWSSLVVLAFLVPSAPLRTVLRRARDRAASLPYTAQAEPVAVAADTADAEGDADTAADAAPALPVLPPVPAPTRRETTMSFLVLAVVLAAVVASGTWSYQRYTAYPRYTVAAPDRLRGYERLEDTPIQQVLKANVDNSVVDDDAESFSYVYGNKAKQLPVIMVFGAVGDFHDMTPDVLGSFQDGLESGLGRAGLSADMTWSAALDRPGGGIRCASFLTTGTQRLDACFWGDKGSMGTVLTVDTGRSGRDAMADLTREVRGALLHDGAPADSV
ncbi:hypothetical protein [Streptomyces sp. NPDC047000]|uniref:hypothetical protein n=1 Tax=Streptomyces sp. NPDC047000 TaxID=3155474 RepID=UPI00340AFEFE